jgi:hypothetical protein
MASSPSYCARRSRARAAEELRAQLRATHDPASKVWLAAAVAHRVYEQMTTELELLRGAGLVAPDLANVEREVDDRRHAGVGMLVDYLANRNALRAGLAPSAEADLAWAITGPDLYHKLIFGRGWTVDDYECLVGDVLVATLLAPQAARTAERSAN